MQRRHFLNMSALGALSASLGVSHNAFAQSDLVVRFPCRVRSRLMESLLTLE